MYNREIYAPGTILQIMYIKERMRNWVPGSFVEVGPGQGYISKLLLDSGWSGVGYDLNIKSVNYLNEFLASYIDQAKYEIFQENFIGTVGKEKLDLIISSMVLEHLSDSEVESYMETAKGLMSEKGRVVFFLPANIHAWGVEDEIAGHFRRYDRESVIALAKHHGLKVSHIAGVTFPVSNILLPLSNYLVARAEGEKKNYSMHDKTVASGIRDVPLKTNFPPIAKAILNEHVMYPLHLLQKAFRHSSKCMVLYSEFTK